LRVKIGKCCGEHNAMNNMTRPEARLPRQIEAGPTDQIQDVTPSRSPNGKNDMKIEQAWVSPGPNQRVASSREEMGPEPSVPQRLTS
jgi:hypothetical protein